MPLQHRPSTHPMRRGKHNQFATQPYEHPFKSVWSRQGPVPLDRKFFISLQTFAALSAVLFLINATQPEASVRLWTFEKESVQVLPHVHDPPKEMRDIIKDDKDPERDDLAKDPNPFTQGLLLVTVPGRNPDGSIFQQSVGIESTGLYGSSIVRIFSLESGATYEYFRLPDHVFGEGITMLDEVTVLVLTWKEKMAYAIEFSFLKNLVAGLPPTTTTVGPRIVGTFRFDFEGWGLTSWNRKLWATTGGDVMLEFDITRGMLNGKTRNLRPSRLIPMTCFGRPLKYVNELEYHPATKTIWGNVFGTQIIVELNPETGECVSIMSMAGLYDPRDNSDKEHADIRNDVANGVAIDEQVLGVDRMLLTGKRWPWLYIVKKKPVFVNDFPTSWNDVARRIQLA